MGVVEEATVEDTEVRKIFMIFAILRRRTTWRGILWRRNLHCSLLLLAKAQGKPMAVIPGDYFGSALHWKLQKGL